MPQTIEATPSEGLKVYSNGHLTAQFKTELDLANLIEQASKALSYKILDRTK